MVWCKDDHVLNKIASTILGTYVCVKGQPWKIMSTSLFSSGTCLKF